MLNKDYLKRMEEILDVDFNKYLKSLEEKPIKSFRINENYITKEEFINSFSKFYKIKPIPYLSDGFYLFDSISGNSLIHQSGLIYFQEPSAMMPVNAIEIKPDAVVLDLCSSPGGKALQILSKLKNGFLVANEIDNKRLFALQSNLIRFGYSNYIILNDSPKNLEKDFQECFDYIFLDAPCSGEGMFRKDEKAVSDWSVEHVLACKNRDIKIITSAIKMLKNGGYLVYSTCTFSKEENEDIVLYAKSLGLEEVDVDKKLMDFTSPGINNIGRRFYPHKALGEGQYIAVLKKNFGNINEIKYITNSKRNRLFDEFLKANINKNINYQIIGNKIYYTDKFVLTTNAKVYSKAVLIGEIKNNYIDLEHGFFKIIGKYFYKNIIDLETLDSEFSKKYLKGEEQYIEGINGFGVFTYKNALVGGFKAVKGRIKNYYPKNLRIK